MIDYSKYSAEDLRSALAGMDREKYPENHRNAQAALAKRVAEGAAGPPVDPNWMYRNFWRRAGASLIDGLILIPVAFVPFYLLKVSLVLGAASFVLNCFTFSVYELFFVTRFGATPGKLAMGIRIAKQSLHRVDFPTALKRTSVSFGFAFILVFLTLADLYANREEDFSSMTFAQLSVFLSQGLHRLFNRLQSLWGLSELVTMLFNDRRRAIHDFIAGTVVVRKQFVKEAP